jgi:hypothetical protein
MEQRPQGRISSKTPERNPVTLSGFKESDFAKSPRRAQEFVYLRDKEDFLEPVK